MRSTQGVVPGLLLSVMVLMPGAPLWAQAAFDIQAHRGGLGLMTESTLQAFANALEMGVSTLELDTQVSADGVVIVTHDRQILPNRCLDTEPAIANDPDFPYVGKYIRDLDWDQIRTLDCGSQRAAAYADQRTVPGARMVLLSEVFDLVKRYRAFDVQLNIETKVEAGAPQETAPREVFVRAVLGQIEQHRMQDQVSIQSFDWGALMLVRTLAPQIPIIALSNAQSFLQCGMPGASPWTGGIDMDDFDCNLVAAAASFGADAISPVHGQPQDGVIGDSDYEPFTTAEMVTQAKAAGLKVIPWTVNDPATMAHLIELGVDGIITDYPDRLRELAARRSIALPASFTAPDISPELPLHELNVLALQQLMAEGSLSSATLVEFYLQRIQTLDDRGPALNAMIQLNPDSRAQARALDEERQRSGPRSLLHGIPIVVKDNYNTTDMPTTGASTSLADFVPSAEASQLTRLREAGAVILGKTNLHEFAYGITSISSLGGQTRNPYDPQRMPGGSSGGSAAAVAAGFAPIGLGSDTCGSIRIPAAYNNLVGLRPSKGLSSIAGIMPLSHTQDVAGPLARSIEDLAIVLDLTAGYDPLDPDTAIMQTTATPRFLKQLEQHSLQGLRIGRLRNYMEPADAQVQALIDQALTQLADQGAVIIDMEIAELQTLIAASGLIAQEFESDLNTYLQTYGSELQTLEQIVAGGGFHDAVANVLRRSAESEQNAEAVQAAMAGRQQLAQTLENLMTQQALDVIVYPPIGSLPALIGEPQPGNNCSLSAHSGYPALSVPVGFSNGGLPVGMELLAPAFSDEKLLSIGYAIQQLMQARRAPEFE